MNAMAQVTAQPELLDAVEAANLLSISKRHLIRLADAGHAPAPLHLGRVVRWRRAEIMEWLANGCKSVNR